MERYYFYIDQNGVQRGPLPLKQLVVENISPSTMVWHEGLSDWQCASQIGELQRELELVTRGVKLPPPVNPSDFESLYDVRPPVFGQRVIIRPKKWIVEAVLVTIFCCMPMGIVALVYALRAEDKWNAGLYDEAIATSRSAGIWIKVSLFAIVLYPIMYLMMLTMGILPFMFM